MSPHEPLRRVGLHSEIRRWSKIENDTNKANPGWPKEVSMHRGIVLAAALLLSAVSIAPQTASTQDAGTIDAVVVPAMVLRGTRVIDVGPSTTLLVNDVLRTDATGRMRSVLKDGSVLTVGENSE